MPSPFAELLTAVSRAMGRLGAGWYVFGAQAAILHGASRLTADVDVTVALGERSTRELVDALGQESFTVRVADADEFIERTRVLPMHHQPTGIDLDVVLGGPGPEELFLRRAQMRSVEGCNVPVACAEDIIVMKILAGRPKDHDDVLQILTSQGETMDLEMVRETLAQLESALGQGDLVPELDRLVRRARRPRS